LAFELSLSEELDSIPMDRLWSCLESSGEDAIFEVSLAAGSMLEVTSEVPTDMVAHLLESCPARRCLASAELDEGLSWINDGEEDETLFVLIERADPSTDPHLAGTIVTSPPGDRCEIPIEVTTPWSERIDTFTYTDALEVDCLPDRDGDYWFEISVEPGEVVYATVAGPDENEPIIAAMVGECDALECLARDGHLVVLRNDGEEAQLYHVVVGWTGDENVVLVSFESEP